jgi:uncharacterized protein (DUF2236 family)
VSQSAPAPALRSAPVPLGPDSLTWKDFGSLRFHLMLQQAFVLQVAHPVIDAGVGQHSVYRTDPWGRARRSVELLWPVVYARPVDAIRKGVELREVHRRIKGVDKHGKRYHALDPEAYGWVHITGFDATLRMHELLGTPPNRELREQMFREWRQMGLMMGLRDQDLPETEAEYWAYFEMMINEKLEMGDVVTDLLSREFYTDVVKPDLKWLPDTVWKQILKVIGPLMRFHTIGTLPPLFRKRFDIPWSEQDERRFRRWCRLLRLGYPLLPFNLRYIPLARNAIRDARKHPDAYRLPTREELQQLLAKPEVVHGAG